MALENQATRSPAACSRRSGWRSATTMPKARARQRQHSRQIDQIGAPQTARIVEMTRNRTLLHGVAVEPGDCAQPARHCRAGPDPGLQIAREALDVRTAGAEQAHVVLAAAAANWRRSSAYASRVRSV